MHKRICDLGDTLLLHADTTEASRIEDTVTSLGQLLYTVINSSDAQQLHLDSVHQECLECEKLIEDLLIWLRSTHIVLHKVIPKTHKELLIDLARCQDTLSGFIHLEHKHQQLLAKEKAIFKLVPREGFNILHERIQLLDKQWAELQQQTVLREHRVTQDLSRWTTFNEHLKSIMDWTNSFIEEAGSYKDMLVEDSLNKMKSEYKQQLQEKELEKQEVLLQGRQLIMISCESQSSDIELKLLLLEDKWHKLKDILVARQHKLQETVSVRRQLKINLKNLNLWLSFVENQQTTRTSFIKCGLDQSEKKFKESQELQLDIQHHSTDVSSVLNLCTVLLRNPDVCSTKTECITLQHTMNNLVKRWQNVCTVTLQRINRSPNMSSTPSFETPASPNREAGRDSRDGQASARQDFEKSSRIDILLHQQVKSLDDCDVKLTRLESALSAKGDIQQKQPLSGVLFPALHIRNQEKNNLDTEPERSVMASYYKKHAGHTALFMRVIRAALPLYLLFLLLLLLFCLLPVCEDEYQCTFGNNLHHSISPMLHYTDGAPPT
ncbi:unnamed protein product [Candidula unifasciata]|uniref:KASH domain-containing protein n=1 Tax=Candidula unifasciata TaxID=100452 RepID=A0A8S3Z2T7_9EUPU|nr:unnamed protein product [Candidula unifasciata]